MGRITTLIFGQAGTDSAFDLSISHSISGDTPLMLENSRGQRGTVRYQILSKQKIFHYFMHMRAKNNMGILDLNLI